MFGIPFTIRRTSERGIEDEVVYIRSYRRGAVGQKMRQLMGEYHAATMRQMQSAAQAGAAMNESLGGTEGRDLQGIADRQQKALDDALAQSARALKAAEEIAANALAENYPDDVREKILDKLTDHELHGLVSTIEMGAMPKDFFALHDIQPRPSTTGPSGAAPAVPS